MLGTVVYQLIINGKLAKLTENITLLQREIGCQDTFCMEQNFKKSLCKKKKKKKKKNVKIHLLFKKLFFYFKIFLRGVGLYKGFSGIALDKLALVARDKPQSHEKKYSGNGATFFCFCFIPILISAQSSHKETKPSGKF